MSARQNRYKPDLSSHPGQTIRELLERDERTQADLARQLGVADSYLSDVIRGRRGVSAQLALKLEPCFYIEAEFWLQLQMRHDLLIARHEQAKARKR